MLCSGHVHTLTSTAIKLSLCRKFLLHLLTFDISTPEVAAQVVACTQLGHSQRFVAQQLNLSRSAVRRVYQRFQDTSSFNRRPGAGRRRYTSERDDRFIESTSLTNRRLNAI
jgi:hypothetical protein